MRIRLFWGLVVYYLITGLYIAILPLVFYETGPGVSDTGPYNMHFLRDVGFAFTVSALGIGYGLKQKLKPLVVFGTAWLAIHPALKATRAAGPSEPIRSNECENSSTTVPPNAGVNRNVISGGDSQSRLYDPFLNVSSCGGSQFTISPPQDESVSMYPLGPGS